MGLDVDPLSRRDVRGLLRYIVIVPYLTWPNLRMFQVPAFVIGMIIMYQGKGLQNFVVCKP